MPNRYARSCKKKISAIVAEGRHSTGETAIPCTIRATTSEASDITGQRIRDFKRATYSWAKMHTKQRHRKTAQWQRDRLSNVSTESKICRVDMAHLVVFPIELLLVMPQHYPSLIPAYRVPSSVRLEAR